MKKNILATFIMALLAIAQISAQDLDEILENYFETTGQEKLVKVKSVESTGKIIQMGMEMPFRTVSKRPNMGYLEAEFQGSQMKMGFDGENGWMVAPWTGSAEPIDLSGPDIQQVRDIGDIDGPLWNWEERVTSWSIPVQKIWKAQRSMYLNLPGKTGILSTST